MDLTFKNKETSDEFLKTRVDNVGLPSHITFKFKEHNIRTIRGVVEREEIELKHMLGLSSSDVNLIKNKLNDLALEIRTEPKDSPQTTDDTSKELSVPQIIWWGKTEMDKNSDLSDLIVSDPEPHDKPRVTVEFDGEEDIVGMFAKYFNLDKETIEGRTRKQEVVEVRDIIVYFLRKFGDMSFPAIGRLLGGRDHTTIIHSFRKMEEAAMANRNFETEFADLFSKVKIVRERKQQVEQRIIPDMIAAVQKQPRRNQLRFKEIPERNLKILELYREGLTLENISKVVGVTRERVRQIVIKTIEQTAINTSISKGITMDLNVMADEEKKKRHIAQESKKHKKETKPKENRWSRYYVSCRSCGTMSIPHVRKGLCEQCVGQFRGDRREEIINQHENKCDSCGRSRHEATALFGRDLYITKERKVFCKECFTKYSGESLGSYKNYEWSRFYEKCLKCNTTSVPHAKRGLCENCADMFTAEQRRKIILERGNKCDSCGIERSHALSKYGRDLYVLKSGGVVCKECFQKRNMQKARENKKVVEK